MARAKKATTAEARDRAKDKRLQRKYGITLAERNERERNQEGKCKVCGGPLNAFGPCAVDHFHFRVRAFRNQEPALLSLKLKWHAQGYNELGQVILVKHAWTKAQAIADVKQEMLPWSVRGLLCFKCNYGIGCVERFFDAAAHPENLFPVVDYLRERLKSS